MFAKLALVLALGAAALADDMSLLPYGTEDCSGEQVHGGVTFEHHNQANVVLTEASSFLISRLPECPKVQVIYYHGDGCSNLEAPYETTEYPLGDKEGGLCLSTAVTKPSCATVKCEGVTD